jgi:hypothetical protein
VTTVEQPPAYEPFLISDGVYVGSADPGSWDRMHRVPDIMVSLRRSLEPVPLRIPVASLHMPFAYWEPEAEQRLDEIMIVVARLRRDGLTVGVHCWHGIDRSGVVALAVLMSEGISLDAAVEAYLRARGVRLPDGAWRPVLQRWAGRRR